MAFENSFVTAAAQFSLAVHGLYKVISSFIQKATQPLVPQSQASKQKKL